MEFFDSNFERERGLWVLFGISRFDGFSALGLGLGFRSAESDSVFFNFLI